MVIRCTDYANVNRDPPSSFIVDGGTELLGDIAMEPFS